MSLPKIDMPIFTLIMPSTKKPTKYRPFTVKEEKLLLIAKQSSDNMDILEAVKQVINNCLITKVKQEALTTFDIEYIFLKLRSKSVGDVIDVKIQDRDDNELYEFQIDLDKIEVKFPDNIEQNIQVKEDVEITLKYPTTRTIEKIRSTKDLKKVFDMISASCIESIRIDDKLILASDVTEQELVDWVDHLDNKVLKRINDFFNNIPKLYHKIEYTNSLGSKKTVEFTSLRDFFSLG
jgi:hypothetical protein